MRKFCPMCDSKDIEFITENNVIEYKNKNIEYKKIVGVCNECATRFSSIETEIDNFINAEKEKIDAQLSILPDEVKRIRKKLNWTQAKAQYYIGGGVKAFSKYERGERQMGLSAVTILKALDLGYLSEETLDKINSGISNENQDRCPKEDDCFVKDLINAPVANYITKTGIAERLQKQSERRA